MAHTLRLKSVAETSLKDPEEDPEVYFPYSASLKGTVD